MFKFFCVGFDFSLRLSLLKDVFIGAEFGYEMSYLPPHYLHLLPLTEKSNPTLSRIFTCQRGFAYRIIIIAKKHIVYYIVKPIALELIVPRNNINRGVTFRILTLLISIKI